MKFDMSAMPMMRLVIEGDLPLNELKSIAENTVQPMIERVNGVASTDVMGGAAKEIHVDVSTNRLEAYNLTLSDITSVLASRNIQISSGNITHDGMDYEIVTNEYYDSLDDIRNTIVKTDNIASIRIDDVATVSETFEEGGRKVYINGVPGLYLSVSNESGTNASTISKGVHKMIEQINAELPKGISVRVLSDDTTLIDATMSQVYSSAIEGALLAMLIILLFLRSLKSSFIIGLSIPISFVLTLMIMSFMNLTINLMTMSGLILGLGMTVDSSIVILENIELRRQKGQKAAISAILGSRNMMTAIFASTMTTLCVFVPMLIYEAELEHFGQMFRDMIITVCVSLIASLFVSITLVPALCGSILPINTRTQKPLKNKFLKCIDDFLENCMKTLEKGYVVVLKFCLNNRFLVVTLVVMLLIVSLNFFTSTGMNLSPASSSDDQVNVSISMPTGTNNKVLQQYLFDFQDIILSEIDGAYETIVLNTGTSNSGDIQINLPDLENQVMSASQIKAKLTPYLNQWSDVTISFTSWRGGGGSSGSIDVELSSADSNSIREVADEVIAILKEKVPQVTNINSDIENGSPRYSIKINTDAAAISGVNVSSIANVLKTAITGTTATVYHSNGEDINIVVSLQDEDLINPSDLGALTIKTNNGLMALDNFITYEEGRSPLAIRREDGDRINHVTANIVEGTTVTEVQAIVEQTLKDNLVLPDNVSIEYGGDARDISRFSGTFILIILLAVFLVFVVMAAQFESLVDPFIIFLSIPLLFIGVSIVYKLTGQPVTMYSYVGIVALAGIVVNNGIVLVDFTNQLVREKMPVFKACVAAGKNRLRPILMTTLTTVLGIFPLAFFPGQGAESIQPICLTIVGGLISGAFMTLFISPIFYSLFNKRREKHFDDPESLENQLIELDKLEGRERVFTATDITADDI